MPEQFSNDPGTTLNGAINNSVTSLVVASSTGYPSIGTFRIRIDSEILIVTAVAGTTWTVTRGAESTSAASHSNGAAVNHVVTGGALTAVVSSITALPRMWSGLLNPNGVGTDFGPHNMTTNSLPSPYVVSRSSEFGGFEAYRIFDGNNSTYWLGTTNGVDSVTIDIGTGTSNILGSYSVKVNTVPEPNRAPKDWTMQGSTNNSTWNTVSTVTSQTSWSSGETRTFTCSPVTTGYRYFKINITANNGDSTYTQIAEMSLFTAAIVFTSGVDGDFYIDTAARVMYGPRATTWPRIGALSA